MDKTEKIVFDTDEGKVEFYIIADTRIQGKNYLLVTDSEDEDGEFLVLRDDSKTEDSYADYSFVEDDAELDGVIKVFDEILDDIDLEV